MVVLVESFGGNTECRVRNVQFTFTPASAPWAAQVVEVGAIASLQTSGLTESLSQSGTYSIQAVGKCSDGRSTPASNIVEVNAVFDQPSPEPKGPTTLLGVNSANPPLDHKQKDTYYKGNITGPGSDFIKLSDGIYPNLDFRRVSLSGITAALLYKSIMKASDIPAARTWTSVMDSARRYRQPEFGAKTVSFMESAGMQPSKAILQALMHTYAENFMPGKALDILRVMKEKGMGVDSNSYATAIKAYDNIQYVMEEIRRGPYRLHICTRSPFLGKRFRLHDSGAPEQLVNATHIRRRSRT